MNGVIFDAKLMERVGAEKLARLALKLIKIRLQHEDDDDEAAGEMNDEIDAFVKKNSLGLAVTIVKEEIEEE